MSDLDKIYKILDNNQEGTVEWQGKEWNSMILLLMTVIEANPELIPKVLAELAACDYE